MDLFVFKGEERDEESSNPRNKPAYFFLFFIFESRSTSDVFLLPSVFCLLSSVLRFYRTTLFA
jgi:hypothetical protein